MSLLLLLRRRGGLGLATNSVCSIGIHNVGMMGALCLLLLLLLLLLPSTAILSLSRRHILVLTCRSCCSRGPTLLILPLHLPHGTRLALHRLGLALQLLHLLLPDAFRLGLLRIPCICRLCLRLYVAG